MVLGYSWMIDFTNMDRQACIKYIRNMQADAEVDRMDRQSLADRIEELEADCDRLRKLVYVPGLWKCAKCGFQLVQSNLNANDGSVTARDDPGDKCPNCDVPLWRVTERDAGNELAKRCEQEIEYSNQLKRERDGWKQRANNAAELLELRDNSAISLRGPNETR
jgi:hypothetical protein